MDACPWIPPAASHRSPARRLTAALAASALLHTLATTVLAPGSAGRNAASHTPPSIALTARLVGDEPRPPAAEPNLERIAVAAPTPPRERKKAAVAAPSQPAGKAGQGSGVDLPDSTYYGARQLDVFPALASPFDLRYPARAAAADVRGRVMLLVLIDARGAVDDVSVVEAQPTGYFEDDALRVLRSTRFRPAQKDGRPVKSRIVIEVNYGSE